jgi:hypothetical protein
MQIRLCPLCGIRPESGVIEHLRREHRRTEIEACSLLERHYHGSIGRNAEGRNKGIGVPLAPVKRI